MMEEMKVTEVIEGGVAQKAGIKLGDVLVKVNGKAVTTREEYMEAMQAAGREFPIVVKRDGQEVELKLAFPAPQP
jgi:S1-C subfamily serine protease